MRSAKLLLWKGKASDAKSPLENPSGWIWREVWSMIFVSHRSALEYWRHLESAGIKPSSSRTRLPEGSELELRKLVDQLSRMLGVKKRVTLSDYPERQHMLYGQLLAPGRDRF